MDFDALVVGGDSRIGKALFQHLWGIGYKAAYTSRREFSEQRIYLDLMEPEPLPPARVTYLCAAITGFKQCEKTPRLAFRVNVQHTLEVAKAQVIQGGRVVFLSSSAAENHLDKDYGLWKLRAERDILALPDTAVYRFGPVKSPTRDTYPDGAYQPVELGWLVSELAQAMTDWAPGLHLVNAVPQVAAA